MILFFILSFLIMVSSLFAILVSPWIDFKFLRILFYILSVWTDRLNLMSFAVSSIAKPTALAFSRSRLFWISFYSCLFWICSISWKKGCYYGKVCYNFKLVFVSKFVLCLLVLNLPQFLPHSVKVIFASCNLISNYFTWWIGILSSLCYHCSCDSSTLLPFA